MAPSDGTPQMRISSASHSRTISPDWLLWISWVLASTVSILVGFALIYAAVFLAKAILPAIDEDGFVGTLMFPFLASVQGTFQWLVLRPRIPKSGWWVLASGAGLLVAMAVAAGLVRAISIALEREWTWHASPQIVLLYGVIGFFLALVQLPILWRASKSATVWPILGAIGWLALGLIVGTSIGGTLELFAVGAVPGAISGLGLVWILRTPRASRTSSA